MAVILNKATPTLLDVHCLSDLQPQLGMLVSGLGYPVVPQRLVATSMRQLWRPDRRDCGVRKSDTQAR